MKKYLYSFLSIFLGFGISTILLGKSLNSQNAETNPMDLGVGANFFDPETNSPIVMGPVDADHVRGFELIYATPGSNDMAELAGHLLLRIKMNNNPLADSLGIENSHDMILSFLADTTSRMALDLPKCQDLWEDPQTKADFDPIAETWQALKGLTGGLGTSINRASLASTIYTYTIFQDRNLLRYELILTDAQKKSLLARLMRAAGEKGPDYYFFNRNCASIMAQVVAEGIEDQALASFDAIVLPPNSLVAMFVRHGLAKPIPEGFFSYRRQGLAAKKILFDSARWQDLDPLMIAAFRDHDPKIRSNALINALQQILDDIAKRKKLYQMSEVLQYAEMSDYESDSDCIKLSTNVVVNARRLQKAIMSEMPPSQFRKVSELSQEESIKTSIDRSLVSLEVSNQRGNSHTKLLWTGINLSSDLVGSSRSPFVTELSGGVLRQDLGEAERFAMQRAAEVHLGEIKMQFSDLQTKPNLIGFKGLAIVKFRENLDEVPNVFQEPSRLGLVLKLLNGYQDQRTGEKKINWGGIGIAANLWSRPFFEDYLVVGTGVFGTNIWGQTKSLKNDQGDLLVEVPIWLSGLLTFTKDRGSQFRFYLAENFNRFGQIFDVYESHVSWCHFLKDFDNEFVACAKLFANENGQLSRFGIGVEWHPY